NASEVIIEISRNTQIKTDKLPGFIRKIVDNLVGNSATIFTRILWNKKTGEGSNMIGARGVPVTVNIKYHLTEKSASKCIIRAELDIQAKIPIVGKQLEKFMLPKAESALKKDFERTAQLLAGDA